jgi:hypothetical protein
LDNEAVVIRDADFGIKKKWGHEMSLNKKDKKGG